MKEQFCPLCECVLVMRSKSLSMKCSNVYCDFVDRRSGNAMVDPGNDRRGAVGTSWDKLAKWEHVK